MPVTLHGWAFSPYLRAVRVALAEKRVAYALNELAPADLVGAAGQALTPFGRIPVLEDDGLRLFETSAILRYVDEAFAGPALQPGTPAGRAEVAMLLGLAANHFYPSGVMGAFYQEVYVPTNGGRADGGVVASALLAAVPFLEFAEDRLVGDFLVGGSFTLADALAGAMVHNFALAPSGSAALATYQRLESWFRRVASRPSFQSTTASVPLFGLPA
jgi:glutathione S-transferase